MLDTQNPLAPEGQTPAASGTELEISTPEPKKENVSYDTHRKLLDEKKKVQEERDRLRLEKDAREKKEMEARGEYQKMLEIERKAREELESKLQARDEREASARKLSAVLKSLDSEVDEKYWALLNHDQVAIDPETGEIDRNSVAFLVETVKKTFPEILKRRGGPGFPSDAPKGNMGGKITESEWKKLPLQEMTKYKPDQIIYGS